MKLTVDHLNLICGHNSQLKRKADLCAFMNSTAASCSDIMAPHRLAQFLAQVLHESRRLRDVKEVWGPTAAQNRYEGRRDLGNTQPGDGKRYMGRDIIQVTGRANYRALTKWAKANIGPSAPNFEAEPDRLLLSEYLGLGAFWYWITRVPAKYVDDGNIEMVTKRVNGGLNGYKDRLDLYTRAGLVLLGRPANDVTGFQRAVGLKGDGIPGPLTRAALHDRLKAMRMVKPAKKPGRSLAQVVADLIGSFLKLFAR